MLSACLSCGEPFRYWGQGKLFAIPRDGSRDVERFWLCSACCETSRIHLNRDGDVEVVPLEQRAA